MERELGYIRDSGAAVMIMTVYEALKGVNAKQSQYRLKGAEGSSVVLYLLDFSDIDPLNCVPRLYPEFCYGADGKKMKAIEMNVNPKLYKRLVRYFEQFSCGVGIRHRHFDNGKLFGISIYDPHDAPGNVQDGYRFSFLEIKSKKHSRALTSGNVFDVVHPKDFCEQVKCLGFAHGTGTWKGNAKKLLKSGEYDLKDLIAHREDVYEFLKDHGVDRKLAYRIADDVRIGRVKRRGWKPGDLDALHKAGVPAWYIESCEKIQYLFPRAHDMMLLHHYMK